MLETDPVRPDDLDDPKPADDSDAKIVSMGDLAAAVGVTAAAATAMVQKLAESRLIRYEPYVGVSLSAKGRRLAASVLRRHRLVETFLVDTLGLDWAEVHDEADRLEHAMSDRLVNALDVFLGHPSTDPHGDPIPNAAGVVEDPACRRLWSCEPRSEVRIERILDQSEEFLTYISAQGLRPGAKIEVVSVSPTSDTMVVSALPVVFRGRKVQPAPLTLARSAAGKILVE